MNTIIRELTSAEIFFHHQHEHFNGYLTPFVRVKVTGLLDEDRFQHALAIVQSKHPLLCASIQKIGKKYCFCHSADKSQSKAKFIERIHPDQWLATAYRGVRKVLDVSSGPLCKVLVLNSAAGYEHDIVIIFHHTILDQSSFFLFFQDLLTAYDGDDISQINLPGRERNKRTLSNSRKYNKLSLRELERNYPSSDVSVNQHFTKNNNPRPPANFQNKDRVALATYPVIFDEQQTENIMAVCKENKITLFGLCAAIFLSCIGKYNTKPFYSTVPLSLVTTRGQLGCRVTLFNKLKTYPQNNTAILDLARYYQGFMRELLRKTNVQQWIPKLPKNKLGLWLYVFFQKVKTFYEEHFGHQEIGSAVINVSDKHSKYFKLESKQFVVEGINGAANSFRNRRKQFYLGAIIVNGKLNLTLSAAMINHPLELKNRIVNHFMKFATSAGE